MEKKDFILIPSGPSLEHNLDRAKKAVENNIENQPYMISSIRYSRDNFIQDYLFLNDVEGRKIGVDYLSGDTRENVENCLEGIKGTVKIISYKRHLDRFKYLINKGKSTGAINTDLEVEYIPTESYSIFSKKGIKDFIWGEVGLVAERVKDNKITKPVYESTSGIIKKLLS